MRFFQNLQDFFSDKPASIFRYGKSACAIPIRPWFYTMRNANPAECRNWADRFSAQTRTAEKLPILDQINGESV